MDELEKLQLLSLVSKVGVQLQNHLGNDNKVLANFLISLVQRSDDFASFRAAVASVSLCGGKPLTDTLVASIYRLVPHSPALYTSPSLQKRPTTDPVQAADRPAAIERESGSGIRTNGFSSPDEEGRFLDSGIDREYIIKTAGKESETIGSKQYRSSLSDSTQPTSLPSSNVGRYSESSRRLSDARREDFVTGVLVRGEVANIREFGVFIRLGRDGAVGEGLVRISEIHPDAQRICHPSEVLSRGQSVWVKVISVEDQRISLSMRGIDQGTTNVAGEARDDRGSLGE